MLEDTDKKNSYYNFFAKKLYDTSETLTELVYFLKENDKKFKKFECHSFLSMQVHFSDEEEGVIRKSLHDLRHLKVNELPNTEGFRKILISNGANEDKFTIKIVKKILKISAKESKNDSKYDTITASICKIILAN